MALIVRIWFQMISLVEESAKSKICFISMKTLSEYLIKGLIKFSSLFSINVLLVTQKSSKDFMCLCIAFS